MNLGIDPFVGTELKLNVNIEPMGDITMDDYDFLVEAYCSIKRVVSIPKASSIRIDENNYVVRVDTAETGAGDLKCRITAYIPDSDFADGFRTEVIGFDTGINVIKHI